MKVSKILKFKYLDSYGSSVTNGYTSPAGGAEAYDAKSKAPTPVFASKTHVRVDIELKVLLEWDYKIYMKIIVLFIIYSVYT